MHLQLEGSGCTPDIPAALGNPCPPAAAQAKQFLPLLLEEPGESQVWVSPESQDYPIPIQIPGKRPGSCTSSDPRIRNPHGRDGGCPRPPRGCDASVEYSRSPPIPSFSHHTDPPAGGPKLLAWPLAGQSRTHQPVAVADGHLGAEVLVLQVAGVVAVLVEVVLPVHAIPLPVLHGEVLGQQVGVQGQVEQELGVVGRDFVEDLLLRGLVGQGAPGPRLQLPAHVEGEEVPVLVHLDGEGDLIVIQAGEEFLWGGKDTRGNGARGNGSLAEGAGHPAMPARARPQPAQGPATAFQKLASQGSAQPEGSLGYSPNPAAYRALG